MKIIKILQILCLLVILSESRIKRSKKSLKRRQDEQLSSAETVEQIRNRGTYYLSYTNIDERVFENGTLVSSVNSTDAAATPAAAPAAKTLKKSQKTNQDPFNDAPQTTLGELNLFNTKQVELPNMCKQKVKKAGKDPNGNATIDTKLSLDLQVSLAMNAEDILNCWTTAAGQANGTADFLNLPFLTAEQFAKFYDCSTKDIKAIDNSFILPTDGLKNPANLLSVVLFGNTEKNDISWLEFWVYVCNGNKPAKKITYMAEDPKALETVILGSLEKQQAQLAAREAMMKENLLKEKAAKVQATMMEMAKAGKKRLVKKNSNQKKKHQLKEKKHH